MVADPFAPRLRGNRRSTACAASCRLARITPASHMARLFSGEIERILFISRNERISALPSAGGVAPPTRDVLPPCGTRGTFFSDAMAPTAETSSVEKGDHNARN